MNTRISFLAAARFATSEHILVTGGRAKLRAKVLNEQDCWGKLIRARGIKTE